MDPEVGTHSGSVPESVFEFEILTPTWLSLLGSVYSRFRVQCPCFTNSAIEAASPYVTGAHLLMMVMD